MRFLAALIALSMLTSSAQAMEARWRFWTVEERGVTTCFTGVKYGTLLIGFAANQSGGIGGFIEASLPGTTRTNWQVQGYPYRQYLGEAGAPAGRHVVSGIQQSFLSEIAAGHQLSITTVDGRPDNAYLPLVGSSEAIDEFRRCHGSSPAITANVVPPSAPVIGRPATSTTMSFEDAMDRLTTYTTVLGRGIGCNLDTQVPQQRVYAWMEKAFGTELRTAQTVYLTGLMVATKQQMDGTSPDSCASLAGTISTFPWPEI